MFGCIVASRLVQTNLQQVDATKYVFELNDAKAINHIVVFLTGVPFPEGYGATVHFLWPNENAPPTWQFLGILSNEKPSAIFKLGNITKHDTMLLSAANSSYSLDTDTMAMDAEMPTLVNASTANMLEPPITANLGISIEPLQVCMAAMEAKAASSSSSGGASGGPKLLGSIMHDPGLLAMRLLENLYNYCASFATGQLPPGGMALFGNSGMISNTFIPLKSLQDWYGTLQRKFKADPTGGFLK